MLFILGLQTTNTELAARVTALERNMKNGKKSAYLLCHQWHHVIEFEFQN